MSWGGVVSMMYGYFISYFGEDEQEVGHQRSKLKMMGVADDEILVEYDARNSLQFNHLLSIAQRNDIIVATEVGRLAKSTKRLCEFIELAKERRLKLIIGDFVLDCRYEIDPITEGMLKMMAIFYNMEREIISQRVRSGMKNAAEWDGAKLGRPKMTLENLPPLFLQHYPKYQLEEITQEGLAKLCNLSRQTISKYIKLYQSTITIHEMAKHEAEVVKSLAAEEKRNANIKYWDYEVLEDMAEGEDLSDGPCRIKTPAIIELKRRSKKATKKLDDALAEKMRLQSIIDRNMPPETVEPAEEMDFSVFDI